MAGKKPHPRQRDPRVTQQPLTIDLLPMDVQEAVKRLRKAHGMSWADIEKLSAMPYSEEWEARMGGAGFVNWDAMPLKVLEAFPTLRLPHSNMQRWWFVRELDRVDEIKERSKNSRDIARDFAEALIEGGDAAVENAARDVIFQMMIEQDNDKGRATTAKYLLMLRDVMNSAKSNVIKERKVAVDEGRLVLLEKKLSNVQSKAGALVAQLEEGDASKPIPLTREQLLEHVKEIYGAV